MRTPARTPAKVFWFEMSAFLSSFGLKMDTFQALHQNILTLQYLKKSIFHGFGCISFDLRVVRPRLFLRRIELCYGDLLHISRVFVYFLENFLRRLKVKLYFENRHFWSSWSEYSNPSTPQKYIFHGFDWISGLSLDVRVERSWLFLTLLGRPSTRLQVVNMLPRNLSDAT